MKRQGIAERRMVDRKTAAEMYSVSPGTLANLLSKRKGPRAYKCGSKVLYKISDLEDFFCATPIETIDSHACGA